MPRKKAESQASSVKSRKKSAVPVSFTIDVYDSSEGWCVIVKRFNPFGSPHTAQEVYGPHTVARFKTPAAAAFAGSRAVLCYMMTLQ